MNVGIAIDKWKLPIFSKHLVDAGYHYTEGPGPLNTLILRVDTTNPQALAQVVLAANTAAARTKGKQ